MGDCAGRDEFGRSFCRAGRQRLISRLRRAGGLESAEGATKTCLEAGMAKVVSAIQKAGATGWYLGKNLSSSQKKRNRKQSSVRARVEHVFRVIKQQFGFQKTRYRGLEKNASQVNLLVGLANLYMLRQQLMAA